MRMAAERENVEMIAERDLFPDVFRSSLMQDGVKVGKDMFSRRFEFENGAVLGAVGAVNTGNGLYAMKKLIFEEKKYTMAQLMEALDADWVGYEDMQADFRAQPKYGNDNEEVDAFVADVYKRYAEICKSFPCVYGGTIQPNAISISAHQPGGMVTGATPDGRKGGEILADASLSPDQGTDVNGPLAVFKSAMKVNHDPYQGTLMNMKFHPSALKSDEDLGKLAGVIKTFLVNGAKHIQFNVVDKEEMIDAKENPDKHPELIVRVAGYSAYFTRLTPGIQDEVINRMSQEL
jgi:formate C-acetyltransferase